MSKWKSEDDPALGKRWKHSDGTVVRIDLYESDSEEDAGNEYEVWATNSTTTATIAFSYSFEEAVKKAGEFMDLWPDGWDGDV